jgi:hypothetical protein
LFKPIYMEYLYVLAEGGRQKAEGGRRKAEGGRRKLFFVKKLLINLKCQISAA